MAIQINGNGTITGISVGGLPNGIVDTDMIAANAVSSAKLASGTGGKILQVVSSNMDQTYSSNSTSYTSIGLNATITPASTSSKILVLMDLIFGGTVNSYNYGRILRTPSGGSGTAIAIGEDRTSSYSNSERASFTMVCLNNNNAQFKNWHATVNFLDSPNTTAATTYAVQGKSLNGGGDGYFYINRMYSNDNAAYQVGYSSNLTLMEIAA